MHQTGTGQRAPSSARRDGGGWIAAAARRVAAVAAVAAGSVLATAAQASGDWTFTDRRGEGWCLLQHGGGDIQIWFGAYSDGRALLTVDVRQTLTQTTLSVDGTDFAVSSKERPDSAEWRELEVTGDHEAFLQALSTGTLLRAGIRHARLDGLGDLMESEAVKGCLAEAGYSGSPAPLGAAAPMAGGVRGEVIFASGEIDAGFAVDLERALVSAGEGPTVVIGASPGGSVAAAERAARALRSAGATVIVAGSCASACVSLVAGGKVRTLDAGGRLGVHRTTFVGGADAERGQAAVAAAARFFREMGVSVELALIAAATPAHRMRWLTAEEVRDLGLVTP